MIDQIMATGVSCEFLLHLVVSPTFSCYGGPYKLYIYIYMYVLLCIYIYMIMYIYIYDYVYIYMIICVYIYTQIL